MSKKQDAIYFDNFIECAGFASKAALMLKDIFRSFDPARMPQWMDQIHDIEHGRRQMPPRHDRQAGQGLYHPHRAGGL